MIITPRLRTWTLLILVNLGWAGQYAAYRVASDSIGVASLNFWTFAIAAVVLVPYVLYERRRPSVRTRFDRKDAGSFALLSLLGLLPPSVMLAWGISHSSAANASILSLTIPVLMTIMGVFMFRERPDRLVLVSLACACLGTAFISWSDITAGRFSGDMFIGNVVVFISGVGAAFYNAYSKKLLLRHSPGRILVYGYAAAAVQCAVISLFFDPAPFYAVSDWNRSAWIAIGILGVIVWGAAMLLWLFVLDKIDLAQASVSVYMLPIFGVAFSAVALGEHIGVIQMVGAAIVFVSAYFSSGKPAA
jgi:drug/metabolite transporter (DMT)-like permease